MLISAFARLLIIPYPYFRFFDLYFKYDGAKSHNAELKLKRPNQLQEVLDIARQLLKDIQHAGIDKPCEVKENRAKLEQLKTVLEM